MPAAAFDLDGVLVDTESIKMAAWIDTVQTVVRPSEALLEELDAYNRTHRGVPRATKFRHVIQRTGERPGALDRLLVEYARRLNEHLDGARAMPGSREFLRSWPGPKAVVSSAPRQEIELQLRRHALGGVDVVHDGRTSKVDALRNVAARWGATVFFGDAYADAKAAQEAGCAFVALGPNHRDFEDRAIANAENLEDLINEAANIARQTERLYPRGLPSD